ncbi:MAG: Panacea domain-containing protein [Alphaproteobacteria bacterium]
MIKFKPNPRKIIETIVWLANRVPRIDDYHVMKIIYYADKKHLNKYGRPILGDEYIKMENGPVGSLCDDIIKGKETKQPKNKPYKIAIDKAMLKKIREAFTTTPDGDRINITAKKDFYRGVFSISDLECLRWATKQYQNKTFDELKHETHQEKPWRESKMNKPIDYILFIEDDNPNKKYLKEDLQDPETACMAF